MKVDQKYTTPDGEEFCEKSVMVDTGDATWNVSRIEEWPPGSGTIKVTLMGAGNPNFGINLNEMIGWKVVEYDSHI